MDDIVKQAMAKWPNVPDCYGWLGLDARGQWFMRDDGAQAQGAFASGRPGAKGSRLQHEKLIDFIQRNYAADASGRWFFQNGPQRVFVELEATPWVWRVADDGAVAAHTGATVQVQEALLDEDGWLYLVTDLGVGLVHTQDTGRAAQVLEQGLWSLHAVHRADLPQRFGYALSPQAQTHLLPNQ
nr:DUF2946 family protein [uncultured Rhodoferax sp.]